MSYIIRCALPVGHTITMKDLAGKAIPFTGQLGMAPEWETGSCNVDCQEKVSACVLAHVNTSGQHIALMLDGTDAALGWGRNTAYPYQEGSFFGNIFTTTLVNQKMPAFFCNGTDFDSGVVPGRLGATQSGAPYINPQGPTGLCVTSCSQGGGANNNDGYTVCRIPGGPQYTHIVTVYRDFDPASQYKICNRMSGLCLTSTNSTVGGQIIQTNYNSASAQKWKISQSAAGKYKVVNAQTGLSLDTAGSRTADTTSIVQATYANTGTQQWKFAPIGDGTSFFKVQPAATQSMSFGYSSAGNNYIQLQTYNYNDGQKWSVLIAN